MNKLNKPEAVRAAVIDAVKALMQGVAPCERMNTKEVLQLVQFVATAATGVVLSRIAAEMTQEQLDETHASTPGGQVADVVNTARDLGYRAGNNDAVRRWGKLLREAVHAGP